jgi:gamma-glutamylcyclotransferase (GGCT)/AIG2-like uncharacterized protein YtfP
LGRGPAAFGGSEEEEAGSRLKAGMTGVEPAIVPAGGRARRLAVVLHTRAFALWGSRLGRMDRRWHPIGCMSIDHHLVTYGTLAPGRPNHHQLSGLRGDWVMGIVKGRLVAKGWGAALGFPALILADDGDEIEAHLFVSPDLPDHWDRLDAFEGCEYRRSKVQVLTASGAVEAWIYIDADALA